MLKRDAKRITSAIKHIEQARKLLDAITDEAVERDHFYSPSGLFEDLHGMSGALELVLTDYQHREYDALRAVGRDEDADNLNR